MPEGYSRVCAISEIPASGRLSVYVDDRALLVLRIGENLYAIEDVCTHDGQPLTNGPLNGTEITCPRHGARFDVQTGKQLCMPATSPIPRFAVKVEGNDVLVGPEVEGDLPPAPHVATVATAEVANPAPSVAADPTTAAPTAPVQAPDESALLSALKNVIDPELMINVVDLGLVYAVQLNGEKVLAEMTLTSPACPAGPQIITQAKMALELVEGVKEATIKLVMSPPWSPDRMTDEARDKLGIF